MKIYGPIVSTYVRIVSIAAEEAGLSYEVVPTAADDPNHQHRHPFQKVPSVEIDGHSLYESVAICQYIDEAHNGAKLQPTEPLERAQMAQWISVANQYVFPTTEQGLVLPRLVVPLMGGRPREDLIERALPTIAYQMHVLRRRLEVSPYFAGDDFSLADIFFYPMLRAVQLTPEGNIFVNELPAIREWLARTAQRASVAATAWPRE